MSTQIPVLCDYDALYAAIELKLSALPQVHVFRFESIPVGRPENGRPTDEFGLIIVAPIPPINDPMSMLSRTSLLNRVGQVPVLVISEQPSRPESDDRITYLNFPFDMDDLTDTVADILKIANLPMRSAATERLQMTQFHRAPQGHGIPATRESPGRR